MVQVKQSLTWIPLANKMIEEKPYAISCDRNSEPILEALKPRLKDKKHLLEIGSGTGQHAIFMAPHFSQMTWTLSDVEDNHKGIRLWLRDFPRFNLLGPMAFDLRRDPFPEGEYDVVFTANTLHIMSWELDLKLFDHLGKNLSSGAHFLVYGAFNYNGQFTSESNERFEKWLKERDPLSGIRDFEKVSEELSLRDFKLAEDIEMPANNRLLSFVKN